VSGWDQEASWKEVGRTLNPAADADGTDPIATDQS